MLQTLAVGNYRSLRDVAFPLRRLNVITGPNGCGKSSAYRALRLLAETANGGLIAALAREGGLESTLWAGPADVTRRMRRGEASVEGNVLRGPKRLQLGYSGEEFSYTVDLGMPPPPDEDGATFFDRDALIKRECVWHGPTMRHAALCADRRGNALRCRPGMGKWVVVDLPLSSRLSMLSEFGDPAQAPELVLLREQIRSWRFYDYMRTDLDAPARRRGVATFTPALANDGSDLACALATIHEVGDVRRLVSAVDHAFPGSRLEFVRQDGRIAAELLQHGMLRPLSLAELSDGTLRFLLLAAALLTPRPPALMVLNEPETSLHPALIPALGRLIATYAEQQQIIVVTHSAALVEALDDEQHCMHLRLAKELGATQVEGLSPLDRPAWRWPAR